MVELNLEMLPLIYKADSSYEKVAVITEFPDKYRMLQMLSRSPSRQIGHPPFVGMRIYNPE